MEFVLQVTNTVASIAVLICTILVLVKMFQNKQTGLAIASIVLCFLAWLITLIVGWKNRAAWQLGKVMPIFTLSVLLSFVSAAGLVAIRFKQEPKPVESEFSGEMEVPDIQPTEGDSSGNN